MALAVNYSRRYDAAHVTLKEWLESGGIGDMQDGCHLARCRGFEVEGVRHATAEEGHQDFRTVCGPALRPPLSCRFPDARKAREYGPSSV